MPPLTLQQAFEQAVQHHQAGRLPQAEQLYRQILTQQPNHADALHFLGILAAQSGQSSLAADLIKQAITLQPHNANARYNLANALIAIGQRDEAIAAYRQAITLRPDFAGAYSNLGNALKDTGQLDEAIAAYGQAIARQPNLAEAHHNLGLALHAKKQTDRAIDAYRQALALRPNYPEAHFHLGLALRELRQLDPAIASFRQAVALHPAYLEAHNVLGNTLRESGCLDQAIASYRHAILLNPRYFDAYNNLGVALKEKGQFEASIAALRQAIELSPHSSEAHSNLGNALQELGHRDAAIAAYRQAIALKPESAEAHSNLGAALMEKGQLDEAIAAHRQSITLDPASAAAFCNLGNALQGAGQLDPAVAAYRQALALQPNNPEANSNLLLVMHYVSAHDPEAIAAEHRQWSRQYAEPFQKFIQPPANDRSPDRLLRIGYVSPDFRAHAVAPMVLPLLAAHDRTQFQIFCYAQVQNPDAMTAQFRAVADQWRSTVGLSDEQVATLIRQDQIDILVDLAGHTAGNRLLVLARKPAPVQVTRQGYPNTTGLSTIDYRMTDAYADPPGLSDRLHSEQLIRLPQTNWIYQPPPESPTPMPRPAGAPITFGCFNNFAKVTEPMLILWSRILQAVPESKLLLKALALDSPSTRQRIEQIFIQAGIAPARLDLRGYEPSPGGHLALYNQMDIALDPYPYHGTTTTCEALWMGVPVITLAGQTHVARVGVSLLTNLGLPELIADNPEAYLKIAVDLANDRPRLAHLRATLRPRMQQSPLINAPQFARHIEAAYRQMWHQWCASSPTLR